GVAAYLRAGGTVSPHVLLGADLGLWDHGAGRYGNSGTGDLYGTFDLLLYPSAAAGGFLKLGAGLFVGGRGSGEGLDAAGMAGTVGGGWDVRLPFGGLDVTPGLDVLLLRDADASGSEALHAVYLFTVGVGFH
ncbi:MAG TPA: hypothetical protein VKA44_07545, partial [Gemmatimonadota bacterium]|nr:hypothetical protein [Gemmatimonadota bacterium]